MLANSGDVFYIVSLITALYRLSESAFVTAALPFTITIAQFLAGFAAPLVIDRWPLKRVLVYSQAGKTMLLACLAAFLFAWENPQLMFVFTFVFIISFLDGWANPAKGALLPRLVEEKEWMKANAFTSMLDQVVQLGGWAFGGILCVLIGDDGLLVATCLLYVISTAVMGFIQETRLPASGETAKKQNMRSSLQEGWRLIWEYRALRYLTLLMFLGAAANVVWIAAILYVYVEQQLGVSQTWWGFINTCFFLGLITGGAAGMKWTAWIEKRKSRMLIFFTAGLSIVTLLFGLTTMPIIALALSFAYGFGEELQQIVTVTMIQKNVPAEQLPKVYAAQGSLIGLVFGCSSLLAGSVAEAWDIRSLFIGASLILLFGVFTIWRKQKRLLDQK